MSTLRSLALAWLCVAFCSTAQAEPRKKPRPSPSDEQGAPNIAACAVVHADARMEAYGYSHVVVLESRCDVPVTCDVWTDVDPSPRNTLRAAPGESVEVLTRRGSPAREVNAQKECRRS